ncbi:MAG: DNA cytosine methyltransferase [Pseudonocardiaceae bacterium]
MLEPDIHENLAAADAGDVSEADPEPSAPNVPSLNPSAVGFTAHVEGWAVELHLTAAWAYYEQGHSEREDMLGKRPWRRLRQGGSDIDTTLVSAPASGVPIERAGTPVVGSLCTGIGGLDLAIATIWPGAGWVWVADNDPDAATVLAARFPTIPNLGDLTHVDPTRLPVVDVLTAGYPCQPFSTAGRRQGDIDDRYLWPTIAATVRVLRPRTLVLENIAGHLPWASDEYSQTWPPSGTWDHGYAWARPTSAPPPPPPTPATACSSTPLLLPTPWASEGRHTGTRFSPSMIRRVRSGRATLGETVLSLAATADSPGDDSPPPSPTGNT